MGPICVLFLSPFAYSFNHAYICCMEQNRKDDSALLGIGAALKTLRQNANISKRQMETVSNIRREQIEKIEKGRIAPTLRTVAAYLDALGIDLAQGLLNMGNVGKSAVESAVKAKAGRPKKKGWDYSLLPPMEWEWSEMEGCWKAVEVMKGHQKNYRVWEDGRAEMRGGVNENEGVKVWQGGIDKESAIQLITDWRYYDGYQLPV